jgi:hypothetical protein
VGNTAISIIDRMHINKDQLQLPGIPCKKTVLFCELKPRDWFRDSNGFIFYCSRGQEEWQEKSYYAVSVNFNILNSPTTRGLPKEYECVDVLDRQTIVANLP